MQKFDPLSDALVDWLQGRTCGANEQDCRQGQLASCDAIGGELTSGCLRLSARSKSWVQTVPAP